MFVGPATEKIAGAREGLWNMKNRPEISFRCGPLALHRIKLMLDPEHPATDVIREDGAMARPVHLSRGETPGATYANELFGDLVIHGWDLAKGIGADDTLDAGWVEMLYEQFAPHEREMKAWGIYGDMVIPPPDADLQTKLLAVLGRRRDWPAA